MTQRSRLWSWSALALASAAWFRLPSLNLLLDRDEGEYATLAWLWREGHGLPYRDFLEQKPPFAILMNHLAQAAFADGVLGLRVVSLAWIGLTVLALVYFLHALAEQGHLGRRLQKDPDQRALAAGLGGVVAGLLLSGVSTQALAANTETWQTLPLLGALAALFLPAPAALKARHYLLAGLWLGLASLFKQPLLAGVLILPWAAQRRDGQLLQAVGLTALGAALPWFAVWACFVHLEAGREFLNCTLVYNQAYVQQGLHGAWSRGLGLARHLLPILGAWAGLAWLGWRSLGRDGASRRWAAAWLGLAAVALAASGRFYPHYAVLLLAPLALLAGLGLAGLAPAKGPGLPRAARALRWLLLGLGLLGWAVYDGPLWLQRDAASRTLRVYQVETFAQAPAAAERLKQITTPEQKIFIWGDEAQLYYLARRAPATRFLFTYPFTGEAPPWPDGDGELLAGLSQASTGAAVMTKGIDQDQAVQRQIFDLLGSQYEAEHGIPGYILGARKH